MLHIDFKIRIGDVACIFNIIDSKCDLTHLTWRPEGAYIIVMPDFLKGTDSAHETHSLTNAFEGTFSNFKVKG